MGQYAEELKLTIARASKKRDRASAFQYIRGKVKKVIHAAEANILDLRRAKGNNLTDDDRGKIHAWEAEAGRERVRLVELDELEKSDWGR